ncbi:MAG TPA: hypothetical protein VFQ80_17140 [Thermomicrobiales bacterium]|jgi:hypothetical protein|nr:hypothetical protein [Thermomicrobiales bacterium]
MTESSNSCPPRRIPDFANREEEAAWWDTHDITDDPDELKPINARFDENLGRPSPDESEAEVRRD